MPSLAPSIILGAKRIAGIAPETEFTSELIDSLPRDVKLRVMDYITNATGMRDAELLIDRGLQRRAQALITDRPANADVPFVDSIPVQDALLAMRSEEGHKLIDNRDGSAITLETIMELADNQLIHEWYGREAKAIQGGGTSETPIINITPIGVRPAQLSESESSTNVGIHKDNTAFLNGARPNWFSHIFQDRPELYMPARALSELAGLFDAIGLSVVGKGEAGELDEFHTELVPRRFPRGVPELNTSAGALAAGFMRQLTAIPTEERLDISSNGELQFDTLREFVTTNKDKLRAAASSAYSFIEESDGEEFSEANQNSAIDSLFDSGSLGKAFVNSLGPDVANAARIRRETSLALSIEEAGKAAPKQLERELRVPDVSDVLDFVSKIEPGGGSELPAFIRLGLNMSLIGSAKKIATGEDLFDVSDSELEELSRPERILAEIVSFLSPLDLATVIGGGGAGGAVARKAIQKLIEKKFLKEGAETLGKKLAERGAAGAGALGTLEAVRESARQQAEGESVDFGEIFERGAKGGALGALLGVTGGLTASFGRIAQFVSEVGAGGTAAPLLEGQAPTFDDYLNFAGVVLGLKAAFGVAKIVRGDSGVEGINRNQIAKELQKKVETEGKSLQEAVDEVFGESIKLSPEDQVSFEAVTNKLFSELQRIQEGIKDEALQVRETEGQIVKEVLDLSRRLDEKVAKIESVDARAAAEGELQELRRSISETGEITERTLQDLSESELTDASSRLQETLRSDLDVQGTSPKLAQDIEPDGVRVDVSQKTFPKESPETVETSEFKAAPKDAILDPSASDKSLETRIEESKTDLKKAETPEERQRLGVDIENLESVKREASAVESGTTLGFMGSNPEIVGRLGKDVARAYDEISSATKNIIDKSKVQPEVKVGTTKAIEAMIEHDRQIRRAEFTSQKFTKIVEESVKSPERQMEMVHAYEQKMQGKHWDVLTEAEKDIVRWAAQEKAKLNKFVEDNDVLERLDDPDVNHIFHHWINPKTGQPYPATFGKFSKGLPQAKQRTIKTYEDGIEAGLKPATTNIGKLIGLEWESVMRAHQSRQMFRTLHNIGADPGVEIQLVKGGTHKPIRMIERWDQIKDQGLDENYERFDHPSLDKQISFINSAGDRVTFKGAVGIRKELFPFVRNYIENPKYSTYDQLNFATKSLKLGLSAFHVMSLAMQEVANFRIPFYNIPRGLRTRNEMGPELQLLHQEGLELFKGYEDTGSRNRFFEGVTIVGKVGNVATWPVKISRDFIFNVVQPGMKTSFAVDTYNKILPKYLDKGLTKERAARDAVKAADGHFSGEHFKRSLLESNRLMNKIYFSPEARVWWQRALLSPTWQREHLLVAKNVGKAFMPDKLIKKLALEDIGPIKAEYRKYALGAAMMITSADMYNYMTTQQMDGEGKHIWENPEGKGFAVRAWWDEPDYILTNEDGEKRVIQGGPAYIRPFKSIYEVAEWGSDPVKKFIYKLSPMVTATIKQLSPGLYDKQYEGIEDMPERLLDFVLDVSTPIAAEQTINVTKGKKTALSAVLPFFGMPTSKVKGSARVRKFYDLWKDTTEAAKAVSPGSNAAFNALQESDRRLYVYKISLDNFAKRLKSIRRKWSETLKSDLNKDEIQTRTKLFAEWMNETSNVGLLVGTMENAEVIDQLLLIDDRFITEFIKLGEKLEKQTSSEFFEQQETP